MLRYIESLRKRPKAVRNQYAFSIALSITGLIAVIWVLSLPARMTLSPELGIDETVSEEPSIKEHLAEIGNIFEDGLSEIQAQAELIGITASSSTSTPTEGVLPGVDTTHEAFLNPGTSSATQTGFEFNSGLSQ